MHIGFIGMGNMGAAMVPHLIHAGHRVSVWNRSPIVAKLPSSAEILPHAADAFACEVVITMLANDAAVREVILDAGALASAHPSCIHVMMSTISMALVEELQARHHQHGSAYVAAPVFGVPATAAKAQLNILAAGPERALRAVQPLFDVLGKKTWHLGNVAAHAHIAKIAGNLMITQAIESMAEAVALVGGYGLSAEGFLDVVTQTLFACPSYQRYGGNIAHDSYEPGFTLSLGLKDVRLALEAASNRQTALPGAEIVQQQMMAAIDQGWAARDWSILAKAPRQQPLPTQHMPRTTVIHFSYAGDETTRFDRDYYLATHLPLVMQAWQRYGLETLSALFPADTAAGTIAICVCQFRDEAAAEAAFRSPESAAVMAEVMRFTDAQPVRSRSVPL